MFSAGGTCFLRHHTAPLDDSDAVSHTLGGAFIGGWG